MEERPVAGSGDHPHHQEGVNSCGANLSCQWSVMDCMMLLTDTTLPISKTGKLKQSLIFQTAVKFPPRKIINNHQRTQISIGLRLLHTWDLTYNYESHTQW